MKNNYEIKYPIRDYRKVKNVLNTLTHFSRHTEEQSDIYFKVKKGRLKLRIINNDSGHLIYYERGESSGKRISKYIISKTADFTELIDILKRQFEILISVHKIREIFIFENVRIHLDNVRLLGKFLEIEIIYESILQAKKQMKELISLLDIKENKLIKGSYSDLLINKN